MRRSTVPQAPTPHKCIHPPRMTRRVYTTLTNPVGGSLPLCLQLGGLGAFACILERLPSGSFLHTLAIHIERTTADIRRTQRRTTLHTLAFLGTQRPRLPQSNNAPSASHRYRLRRHSSNTDATARGTHTRSVRANTILHKSPPAST